MKKKANTLSRMDWWLMILKPGQCIEFNPAEFGVSKDTTIAYVETINRSYGVPRYKLCSASGQAVGVRRLRAGGAL